jgi:hypothetical protein
VSVTMQPRNFPLADVPELLLGELLLDDGLPHAAARRAIAPKATAALSVTLTGTSSAGAGQAAGGTARFLPRSVPAAGESSWMAPGLPEG